MKKQYLFCLVLALLILPHAGNPSADKKTLKGDGILTLYNLHLDEKITAQYRLNNDRYDDEALGKINHILRCRSNHEEAHMELSLIELVDHLQDHFHVDTVFVLSGYRSPGFNAHLKKIGRKVASRSRHMSGQAMDIRLPGVSARHLRDYLLTLKIGGVGYYASNNFVHVDVGPFRTW